MSVAEILASKGHAVVTVKPTDTLEDVSTILAKNKIGAVMVLDNNGDVCGISSERDIVRLIAENGADALEKSISQCMTKKNSFLRRNRHYKPSHGTNDRR